MRAGCTNSEVRFFFFYSTSFTVPARVFYEVLIGCMLRIKTCFVWIVPGEQERGAYMITRLTSGADKWENVQDGMGAPR